MFRVVADQLKISEGWVRCGHCADVFDATLYLQPWIPPGESTTPEDFVQAAPEPEPLPSQGAATEPGPDAEMPLSEAFPVEAYDQAVTDDAMESAGSDLQEPVVERLDVPVHEPTEARTPDVEESDFHAELERFAAGLGRLKAEGVASAVTDAALVDAQAMPDAPAPHDVPVHDDLLSELGADEPVPGFVRQARRQAFWQSMGMRVVLSVLAVVLVLLLAAQWVVHDRDRLAAWQPTWQPLLQRACEPLGCKVAPVRRIDAIVIDSTSLVRRLGNFYAFDLVLKNTAPIALAVPALELTLTDVGEGVISRRVFLPQEWPDAPALLPAQASVSVSFRLSLALGDDTPMAGYRALVFYP